MCVLWFSVREPRTFVSDAVSPRGEILLEIGGLNDVGLRVRDNMLTEP
jgi:hypothetical protein